MKRITVVVATAFLIASFAFPGVPRAQSEPQAAAGTKITLKGLAAQVAALQSTVNSQQTTLNSQQTTLNALQAQLSTESPINALAANFFDFGSESSTSLPPMPFGQGGTPIYDNIVKAPPATNTLYVTIGGTADLDQLSNALFIGCRVDGLPCTGGTAANGSPSGWVMMEYLSASAQPTDMSDNDFYYTWCTHISSTPSNNHTVELRLASLVNMDTVFIEQYHVFVNGAAIPDPNQACTPGTL